MKDFFEKVTATEMREFRKLAMAHIGWTKDQLYQRTSGKVKLNALERHELELILMDMRKRQGKSIDPVFCNDSCIMFKYHRCIFDHKLNECPMYQLITRE